MRTTQALFACTLFALPLSAQAKYQPPTAGELKQLEQDRKPELREVRAGKAEFGQPLSSREHEVLEVFARDYPQEYTQLQELRGGGRLHVSWWSDWGIYLIIPGASTATAVLILLLLLLLIW
jgi:hypothetical protein